MKKRKVIALIIGVISLTIIGIVGSSLPIGINTVERIETQTADLDEMHGMNLVLTDKSMSFTSTRPKSYYALDKFYQVNLINNLILSFLILLLINTIAGLGKKVIMKVLLIIGLITIFNSHIPYWNWWGYSSSYTVGVSLIAILSLIITGYLLTNIINHKSAQNVIS